MTEPPAEFQLVVERGTRPIRGVLTPAGRPPRRFVGWIALGELLEAAVLGTTGDRALPGEDTDRSDDDGAAPGSPA